MTKGEKVTVKIQPVDDGEVMLTVLVDGEAQDKYLHTDGQKIVDFAAFLLGSYVPCDGCHRIMCECWDGTSLGARA